MFLTLGGKIAGYHKWSLRRAGRAKIAGRFLSIIRVSARIRRYRLAQSSSLVGGMISVPRG